MPPRFPAWLVALFAPAGQAEAILGDLHEEFVRFGRRWYWRHALRTALHLAAAQIAGAPWATAAAALLGYVMIRYLGTVPEKSLLACMDRYQVYENHFEAYRFVAYHGLLICHTLTMALIGATVAALFRGREVTSTTAIAAVQTVLALTGYFVVMSRTGHWGGMPLGWMVAFPAAMMAGGIAVRARRMTLAGA